VPLYGIVADEKRGKMNAVTHTSVGLILIGQLLLGVAPHTVWLIEDKTAIK
jgi:hypothetical protein